LSRAIHQRSVTKPYQHAYLFVDIASISYAHYQDAHALVLYVGNDPMISYPVLPEFAEPGTFQRLANAAWVVERGDALLEEFQYALARLRVKLGDVLLPECG